MKINQKRKIIKSIKLYLSEHPVDVFHDLVHAQAVWVSAQKVIDITGMYVEKDYRSILQVACFAHDMFKDVGKKDGWNAEEKRLKNFFEEFQLSKDLLDYLLVLISEHTWGLTQSDTLSQILFDADKLEMVSVQRWRKAWSEYKKGTISIEERDKYVQPLNQYTTELLTKDVFNFIESKRLFEQRYEAFSIWLKKVGWDII